MGCGRESKEPSEKLVSWEEDSLTGKTNAAYKENKTRNWFPSPHQHGVHGVFSHPQERWDGKSLWPDRVSCPRCVPSQILGSEKTLTLCEHCSAVKNKNLVQLSARISAQIQSTATMKKINPTPARSTRNRLSFYASGLLVAGTELTEQETKVLSFLPTKQIQRGCEEHKLPPHCSSNVPQPRPESKSLREKAFVKFLFQLIWQLCWDSLQKY